MVACVRKSVGICLQTLATRIGEFFFFFFSSYKYVLFTVTLRIQTSILYTEILFYQIETMQLIAVSPTFSVLMILPIYAYVWLINGIFLENDYRSDING